MKFVTRSLLFALFCGGILFVVLGCEDKPDTDGVGSFFDGREMNPDGSLSTRSPQNAGLRITPDGEIIIGTDGEIVSLSFAQAQGNVSWSVQNAARGEIINTSSRSATYRRNAEGDNVVTATDAAGRSDSKVIKQPPRVLESLAITPSETITLTNNTATVTLTVSGAEGSVNWSVDLTDLGGITTSTTGSSVIYRRDAAGNNVVRVRDSAGREAMKQIVQP